MILIFRISPRTLWQVMNMRLRNSVRPRHAHSPNRCPASSCLMSWVRKSSSHSNDNIDDTMDGGWHVPDMMLTEPLLSLHAHTSTVCCVPTRSVNESLQNFTEPYRKHASTSTITKNLLRHFAKQAFNAVSRHKIGTFVYKDDNQKAVWLANILKATVKFCEGWLTAVVPTHQPQGLNLHGSRY